jgi:hypothetical protein
MNESHSRNSVCARRRGKLKTRGRVLAVFVAMMFAGALGIVGDADNAFAQTGGVTQGTTTSNFTNVGSAGAIFTKLWVGARASGMAGAYSAMTDDVTSLYWNPAGIANLQGVNVAASTMLWFGDVTENFVGVTLPVSDKYRAGFALTLVDYGSLSEATIAQPANAGTFNANDLSFAATIAGALTDRFSFGATAKYLQNNILDMSASGFAFDAGSEYLTDFYHMRISMDIANLGPNQSFSGNSLDFIANNPYINQVRDSLNGSQLTQPFSLPLIFRLGLATDVLQGTVENQKLNMDFDFSTHSDGPEQYNLGAEYVWNDMASLRAGYAFNEDELGFGIGAGFHYKSEDFSGVIDYSFNTTKNLGGIHQITISAAFP